jgi:Ca2+/Na+ antiporter
MFFYIIKRLLLAGATLFAISAFSFKKDEIDRYEAFIFLASYIAYISIIICNI